MQLRTLLALTFLFLSVPAWGGNFPPVRGCSTWGEPAPPPNPGVCAETPTNTPAPTDTPNHTPTFPPLTPTPTPGDPTPTPNFCPFKTACDETAEIRQECSPFETPWSRPLTAGFMLDDVGTMAIKTAGLTCRLIYYNWSAVGKSKSPFQCAGQPDINDIPNHAVIHGVRIKTRRFSIHTFQEPYCARWHALHMMIGGSPLPTNKSSNLIWGSLHGCACGCDTFEQFGGSFDKWGATTLTGADLKGEGFGFIVQAKRDGKCTSPFHDICIDPLRQFARPTMSGLLVSEVCYSD